MDISSLRERGASTLSVTELNGYIKNLIDSNRTLNAISVSGEISNFTDHRSGHLYFSLKDDNAQIKAVMFRSSRAKLKFMPEEGMKVMAHGTVSVYSQTGTVQFYVNSMTPDGIGALYKAYEQLKEKLAQEGLFDGEHKLPIPRFPEKIGVITSPTGAAVRDIINVTGRRYPAAKIYLYPSLVQGEGAEANLIDALDYFDTTKLVDVIIIGRGGGSIEDLWAFNSEALARRIYSMDIPIISAVGHETDFTICDFVSDMRAPTPSAAAELSVPDIRDVLVGLDTVYNRITSSLLRNVERKRERLQNILEKECITNPLSMFDGYKQCLADYKNRRNTAITNMLEKKNSNFLSLCATLDALSPLAVLSRGYSVVESQDGIVKSIRNIGEKEKLKIRVTDGVIYAVTENVQ